MVSSIDKIDANLFPQMPPIVDPQEIEPMTGKSAAETPDVSDTTVGLQVTSPVMQSPRRSGRVVRRPRHLDEYVC